MERYRQVLQTARVIAVVGFSDDPSRTSHQIGRYLQRAGYSVYAVNPMVAQIGELKSYASLADVPEPIDIVNVFRRSEFLAGVVQESIDVGAKLVWAQLGVFSTEAATLAREAGMPLIMDNCIRVTYSMVRT
jgi:predicted CoA-binding protein